MLLDFISPRGSLFRLIRIYGIKMAALEEETGLLSRAFFKQWSGISLSMIS